MPGPAYPRASDGTTSTTSAPWSRHHDGEGVVHGTLQPPVGATYALTHGIALSDPCVMNTRLLSALVLLACSCTDGPGGTPHASSDTTAPATASTSHEPTTAAAPSTGADTTAPATGADTTAGASGPSTGLPTGSTGLTTGDPSGGPTMLGVYARYEVRDNTSTPVEIWATPSCSPGTECITGDFEAAAYDCMIVSYIGQDYIGITYEQATGEVAPCYANRPSWTDGAGYFFDAACTDPALFPGSITQVLGVMYYGSYEQAVTPPTYYLRSADGAFCFAQMNPGTIRLSEPVQVPAWILDAMPDAPYELAIAY